MSDTFTQTTSRGFFSRFFGSIGGIFIGIALVLASMVGLFWNEGRAINTYRALAEGAGLVVSVSSETVEAGNEGKLVHVSGTLTPVGEPADNQFGVAAPGALRLSRSVEMYQWREKSSSETRNKVGGGTETVTTYKYEKEWSGSAINSSSFKQPSGHENPPMPVEDATSTVEEAKLGAFSLTGSQISSLGKLEGLAPTDAALTNARSILGRFDVSRSGNYILAGNASSPKVGDLRISWQSASTSTASVVGKQTGNGVQPYRTTNGRNVFLIDDKLVAAADMFQQAQDSNTTFTWILRVVGLVAMFIGFSAMLSILGVIGDIIPPIGRLVRAGTGIVALFMTGIVGSLAIAIGWIFYRPLIGLAILVVGAAIAYAASRFGKARGPAPAPQPAQ